MKLDPNDQCPSSTPSPWPLSIHSGVIQWVLCKFGSNSSWSAAPTWSVLTTCGFTMYSSCLHVLIWFQLSLTSNCFDPLCAVYNVFHNVRVHLYNVQCVLYCIVHVLNMMDNLWNIGHSITYCASSDSGSDSDSHLATTTQPPFKDWKK
jgi:hypothetical protein